MKIGLAQIYSTPGDLSQNLLKHQAVIQKAIAKKVDLIVFPELSLTAYEPRLAKLTAFHKNDDRLESFQQLSDQYGISISIGVPMHSNHGIQITNLYFQQNQHKKSYSKQKLHSDEQPYFTAGKDQLILKMKELAIAPAICYESLMGDHLAKAKKMGANVYLANVAKSEMGVNKALNYFPEAAKKFNLPILLCNGVGECDNFMAYGISSVWNSNGKLLEQLDHCSEGILIHDTSSNNCEKVHLKETNG